MQTMNVLRSIVYKMFDGYVFLNVGYIQIQGQVDIKTGFATRTKWAFTIQNYEQGYLIPCCGHTLSPVR